MIDGDLHPDNIEFDDSLGIAVGEEGMVVGPGTRRMVDENLGGIAAAVVGMIAVKRRLGRVGRRTSSDEDRPTTLRTTTTMTVKLKVW